MNAKFHHSRELWEQASRSIPLGSQTFSKSYVQYPEGHAPLFLDRGSGGQVWDVDGNPFVDMVNGLLPVVLGYGDADVDRAIRDQLGNGITFSLPSPLEVALAERLVDIIPCAEQVRFGKNGTDATSAAVRLARAHTGRERIAAIGYHGWQDWYIGSTSRSLGVPESVQALTHRIGYNDLEALEALFQTYPGEIAGVILEPMSITPPTAGYLDELKALAHAHGALVIFDEIITGFRFALGGAQELFGVTPDLAAFGKAMANGMPLAAIVGRRDVMGWMEEIFYSGTFGGETLSLAASIAVIDKLRRENVIEALWAKGRYLRAGIEASLTRHGLEDRVALKGKPPWQALAFGASERDRAQALKTRFLIEILDRGILTIGSFNISYAHRQADLDATLEACDSALERLAAELATGALTERLPAPVIEPVFRVR